MNPPIRTARYPAIPSTCGNVAHVIGKGGRMLIDIQPAYGMSQRAAYSKKRYDWLRMLSPKARRGASGSSCASCAR